MSASDPTPKQSNPKFLTAILGLGLAAASGAVLWWSLSEPSTSSRDAASGESADSETKAPEPLDPSTGSKDRLVAQTPPAPQDSTTAVTSGEQGAVEQAANDGPSSAGQGPAVTVFTNLETLDFGLAPSDVPRSGPEYKEIAVTVFGPNGYTSNSIHSIERGKEATLSIEQNDGTTLPDGLYKYEAYARTELVSGAVPDDAEDKATDESGRRANDPVIQELSKQPPQQTLSGTFRILEGQIVQPDEERPRQPE